MTIQMTPEYRKKMMGLMPISEASTHKFIPQSILDRGLTEEELEFAPQLEVKQWTNEQVIRVKQHVANEQAKAKTKKKTVSVADVKKQLLELIDDRLVGWERVFDPTLQEPVELEFTPENIATLPEPILSDIVDTLTDMCGIFAKTEAAIKKALDEQKKNESANE